VTKYQKILTQSGAQISELEKIAVGKFLSPLVGRLGGALKSDAAGRLGGRLAGGAVGAGTGAAYGHATDKEDPKAGATSGALKGAIVGALGGQFLSRAGREQALRAGRRQLHGATGYLPGRGIFGTKGSKLTAADRRKILSSDKMKWNMPDVTTPEAARKKMEAGTITGPLTRLADKTRVGKKITDTAAKHKAMVGQAQQQLIDTGMTSIPGAAKGYLGKVKGVTPLQTAKANLLAPGLVMGVGLPAHSLYSAGEQYATGESGPGTTGSALGSTLGYSALGGSSMVPNLALGYLSGKAGGGVGKLLRRTPAEEQPTPTRVAPRQVG
jgi:hypothetical protein